MDEVHEGLQVRRRPPFVEIGLAEAQIALADQPREDVGVVDVKLRHRARLRPLGAEDAAIGQHHVEAPVFHAAGLVEHRLEIARQPGFTLDGGGSLSLLSSSSLFPAVWPQTARSYKPN
jgi:hypothetical protein